MPKYHPFRYYLEHLSPWKEQDGDAIMGLSLTVNVRGGSGDTGGNNGGNGDGSEFNPNRSLD